MLISCRSVEVLQNVMENALKYGDGKQVELIFPEDDECVQIAVRNGGCTLGEDDLPHIFESFWRGANVENIRGSGLGLYICRQLMRRMNGEIAKAVSMREDELFEEAKNLRVPYELLEYVHKNGRLPVVNFAAGGVATPADAALMMQLGAEGVFVGSGIFKSGDPKKRAAAIVKAVTNYQDKKLLAELSEDLGEAMVGINEQEIDLLMAERGK